MTGTQLVEQAAVVTTMLLGQVMIAGATGRTVTVNVQTLLPQAFVARHVTVVVPMGKQEPEGGVQPVKVPPTTTGAG